MIKGLWKSLRCIQRMIFVLIVFSVATCVFWYRFTEYRLDKRLKNIWLMKQNNTNWRNKTDGGNL